MESGVEKVDIRATEEEVMDSTVNIWVDGCMREDEEQIGWYGRMQNNVWGGNERMNGKEASNIVEARALLKGVSLLRTRLVRGEKEIVRIDSQTIRERMSYRRERLQWSLEHEIRKKVVNAEQEGKMIRIGWQSRECQGMIEANRRATDKESGSGKSI